jgi:hypothetical protein
MDGATIGSLKILVTNLVSAQPACCFTYGIHHVGDMDHKAMRNFLQFELRGLAATGIRISAITCDGARFQTKAIDFTDKASLQFRNQNDELLSRVLYVPCLCHRLNNAYHRLFKDSPIFKFLISLLRNLAKFCRKPAQKKRLHRTCPEFIETRWVYDHRILHFILDNAATINNWHHPTFTVDARLPAIAQLLQVYWDLVTQLEGSHAHLGSAYPRITLAMEQLEHRASEEENPELAELYRLAARLIWQYTIGSTSDLFQLAYALTPDGRIATYEQLMVHNPADDVPQAAFEVRLDDFDSQLGDHSPIEDFGEEEEVPLDDGGVDPPAGEGETRPEEGETRPEEAEEDEGEEEESNEQIEILPADSGTVFTMREAQCPATFLPGRARKGLERIMRQFRFPPEEVKRLRSAFQSFIQTPEPELHLSLHLSSARYCWLAARAEWPEIAGLADIALRLEPALSSEAPSERTIGQQRRFLMPHRMRTKPDLLLARTQMEDVRHRTATELSRS